MAASVDEKSSGSESQLHDPISLDKVKEAASALVDYVKKKGSKNLLGEAGVKIGLQLEFKKAPKAKNKCIKIPLPHELATATTDVCLFVKDVDPSKREYDDTVRFFKNLLAEKGVTCVTTIIPVKSLKTEYKQFEAKRHLSNMYDVYLADARVAGIMPKMLGKHFYGRRKHPIQVDLLSGNLSKEIDNVINNTRLHLTGRGTSCQAHVAHLDMTVDQIADNAFAAANCLAEKIPGGPDNVQSFYLTSHGVPSLPLFLSTAPGDKVVLPIRKKVVIEDEPEDVTTVVGAKVMVTRRYDVVLVPNGQNAEDIKKRMERKPNRKRKHIKVTIEPVPVYKKVKKTEMSKSKLTIVKQPKKSKKSST
ncbi:ribosomal L1 domain-containing protein 1-like [Lineus longissimus]|uniref:ribosomal L1 domain-containing protein 1-like n=1 Tax=Lineus longissimus TaxID=88925 RepID=UPI002B4D0BE6